MWTNALFSVWKTSVLDTWTASSLTGCSCSKHEAISQWPTCTLALYLLTKLLRRRPPPMGRRCRPSIEFIILPISPQRMGGRGASARHGRKCKRLWQQVMCERWVCPTSTLLNYKRCLLLVDRYLYHVIKSKRIFDFRTANCLGS